MAFEKMPYSNFHDLNLDWIIQQVKEWSAEWAAVKEAYEQFDADLTEINNHLESLDNADIAIRLRLTTLEESLSNLRTTVNNTISTLADFQDVTAADLAQLNTRVEDLEEYATFYMFSPFTGEFVPITEIITELAYFHLENALTAQEYDALAITAQAYDNKALTAIEYDASGKQLLP